jgi:hypothetical protein
MLAPDVRVFDVDAAHWRRILSLFSHPLPSVGTHPSKAPVVLFLEEGRVLKALRIGEGPIARPEWLGPELLPELCKELNASWIAAVELRALSSLLAEVEGQWQFGDDYLVEGLRWAQAVRSRLGDGIHIFPKPFEGVPIPPLEVWRRFFDVMLPDGTCAAFYLFDGPEVWASLIVGKDKGQIDLITTHEALRPAPPLDEWRRDARSISGAIARQLRPVHVAFFANHSDWNALTAQKERLSLARALSEGKALFEPAPPWLRAMMGAGWLVERVSREVEKRAGLFGGLFEKGAAFSGAVGGVIGRAAEAVGFSSEKLDPAREALARALGFDPFAPDGPLRFLAALMRRDPQSPQPHSEDRD